MNILLRPTILSAAALCLVCQTAWAKDPSPQTKDISQGKSTFTTYESWMSPQQQSGEETDAPKVAAAATGLQSTAPSTPREQRKSRGYGQLRFNKELSRAYVDVKIDGINPADILMFHIHCGAPGVLGPVVINFGEFGDLTKTLASGSLSVELANKDLTWVTSMKGMKPALPEGCPVDTHGNLNPVSTIAGLESLARKGVLYFNLHTKAHTFYGEVRGQIYPAGE